MVAPLSLSRRFAVPRFYLVKAGGGGYGDPKKRDRAAIERDIAEGAVTPEAAAKDYG